MRKPAGRERFYLLYRARRDPLHLRSGKLRMIEPECMPDQNACVESGRLDPDLPQSHSERAARLRDSRAGGIDHASSAASSSA
jgi:hypothetical protein